MTEMSHPLSRTVSIETILPILNETENQARRHTSGIRLDLDCTRVDDFTSLALALLAVAQRRLANRGVALRLTQCSERLRTRMVHPLFEALCG